MNKPGKTIKPSAKTNDVVTKTTPPSTVYKQRGIGVFELLFAAATLGTAILFAAMSEPKIPKSQSY